MTPEQRTAVMGVLGQVHISDSTDEDLKAKEDVVRLRITRAFNIVYREMGRGRIIQQQQ